jgi:hypothetical protein
MKCICQNETTGLISDEYIEIYICDECGLLFLKNIEIAEEIGMYIKCKIKMPEIN